MIKYWNKLLKSDENLITRNIYNMLKNDANNNISYNGTNWAFQIKTMLDSLGLSYIWTQQAETDVPLNLIKQRLFDTCYQTWCTDIYNSNRLLTYARFKHEFECEEYLTFIADSKFRTALTRFRLSSHNLHIERGRYENVPRHDRLCRCCNMNAIEDEYHFLLVCPLYIDLRRKFLKPHYCHWPNINKFDSLMSTTSTKIILKLSKFIYYATLLRQETQTS